MSWTAPALHNVVSLRSEVSAISNHDEPFSTLTIIATDVIGDEHVCRFFFNDLNAASRFAIVERAEIEAAAEMRAEAGR